MENKNTDNLNPILNYLENEPESYHNDQKHQRRIFDDFDKTSKEEFTTSMGQHAQNLFKHGLDLEKNSLLTTYPTIEGVRYLLTLKNNLKADLDIESINTILKKHAQDKKLAQYYPNGDIQNMSEATIRSYQFKVFSNLLAGSNPQLEDMWGKILRKSNQEKTAEEIFDSIIETNKANLQNYVNASLNLVFSNRSKLLSRLNDILKDKNYSLLPPDIANQVICDEIKKIPGNQALFNELGLNQNNLNPSNLQEITQKHQTKLDQIEVARLGFNWGRGADYNKFDDIKEKLNNQDTDDKPQKTLPCVLVREKTGFLWLSNTWHLCYLDEQKNLVKQNVDDTPQLAEFLANKNFAQIASSEEKVTLKETVFSHTETIRTETFKQPTDTQIIERSNQVPVTKPSHEIQEDIQKKSEEEIKEPPTLKM